MKASRYNVFIPIQRSDTTLGFNCRSAALVRFSPEEVELIEHVVSAPDTDQAFAGLPAELQNVLTESAFLIRDDEDEIKILRRLSQRARFESPHLGLTIAPTLRCNFQCQYCYEQGQAVDMSPETEDVLVSWIARKLEKLKALYVTWYGGEPLLAPRTVRRLSEKLLSLCHRLNIPYHAKMISNGYLLNRDVATELKALHVDKVQVTVDGPEEVHDARRPLKNGAGTFRKIVDNIKQVHDIIRVVVRVNLDKTNIAYVPELIDVFVRDDLYRKVSLYYGHVMPYSEFCADVSGSCLGVDEFARNEVLLELGLFKAGFNAGSYPRPRSGFCIADSATGWVISPDGKVYKCWNDFGTEDAVAVDDVVHGQTEAMRLTLAKWLSWDPFEKRACLDCTMLPICMGGCPYLSFRFYDGTRGSCPTWKYNLQEILLLAYLRSEVKKAEVSVARAVQHVISHAVADEEETEAKV